MSILKQFSSSLLVGSLTVSAVNAETAVASEKVEKSAEMSKTEEGFTTIFDGKTYDGWYIKLKDGDEALGKKVFAINDGMIHVFDDSWPDEIDLNKGTDATLGMLYTKKSYEKYHLKFSYKWGKKKANYYKRWQHDAGVYYHISNDKVYPTGIEYQIHYNPAKDRNHTADLIRPGGQKYDWYFSTEKGEYLHPDEGGVLLTKENEKTYKHPLNHKWLHNAKATKNVHGINDQWNHCEIIVMGSEYTIHKVNGEVLNMAFNLNPGKGIIGFQSETAEIFYKDIRIKEFDKVIPAKQFLEADKAK